MGRGSVVGAMSNVAMLLSFLLFLGFFAAVGLSSMRVKVDTTDDYLVAGRGMHPALAALSAVSTWNSGYMFIGFIGFTYAVGYSAIWIGLASSIGQVVAWIWLYRYIQEEANERGVRSLSSLVASVSGAPEAKLAAVLSVAFLSVYAAAQLTSGGKALFAMMGWDPVLGILIGFVLVVAYCYAGGIRASIWTDAAQSCVMIIGTTMLCWVALGEVGGFGGLNTSLQAQDPVLTGLIPPNLALGVSLWIFAFFLGGLGVAGQPQVVSRVMTLGSDKERKQAMVWFFVWQTPFIALMLVIGWASRVMFTQDGFDAELGLPTLAMDVLGPFWAGLILASIFAATMSTADSQVLACTAAVTDDIRPEWSQDHATTKKVTLVMAAFATVISLVGLYVPGGDSVFSLVVLAVYGLGGIFVPMLIVRWTGYQPDTRHSVTMMMAALFGVIIWRVLGLNEHVFESIPGMTMAFLAHFIDHAYRIKDGSPLGRFDVPSGRALGIAALVILAPAAAAEGAYLLRDAPEPADSAATWVIDGTVEFIEIGSGEEFVGDGQTVPVEVHSDDANGAADGRNVVGLVATLVYNEDETAGGPGCAAPGAADAEPDTIAGLLQRGERSGSAEGQNVEGSTASHEVLVEWFDRALFEAGGAENISEGDLRAALDGGDVGFGPSNLDLTVTVSTGGGALCNHQDDGETVQWSISLVVLDYTLSKA